MQYNKCFASQTLLFCRCGSRTSARRWRRSRRRPDKRGKETKTATQLTKKLWRRASRRKSKVRAQSWYLGAVLFTAAAMPNFSCSCEEEYTLIYVQRRKAGITRVRAMLRHGSIGPNFGTRCKGELALRSKATEGYLITFNNSARKLLWRRSIPRNGKAINIRY